MKRHRKAGSSKIKYEHHMISGLRAKLEAIEQCPEVQSIIPGPINYVGASAPFRFRVTRTITTGLKCSARSGRAVQDVFIVTDDPAAVIDWLQQHFHT
jgi:hypothetical protein